MKIFRSILGYYIAGLIVMSVWSSAGLGSIGIYGGFLAAIIIIGPLWFMNHFINLTGNDDAAAFVDMGLAIGVCGIARDTIMKGTDAFVSSLPTIALVITGAVIGGIVAALIEKDMARNKDFDKDNPEPGTTRYNLEKLLQAKQKIARVKKVNVFCKNHHAKEK